MHERTAQGPWPSAAAHAFEKCVTLLVSQLDTDCAYIHIGKRSK